MSCILPCSVSINVHVVVGTSICYDGASLVALLTRMFCEVLKKKMTREILQLINIGHLCQGSQDYLWRPGKNNNR